jgi:predicted O-linked N-acetylglucosamine transferase (SPINDLY family)
VNKAAWTRAADQYFQASALEPARRLYQRINEAMPGDFDLLARELNCAIHLCHWQRYDYLQRCLRDIFRHAGAFLIGEPILASPYFTAQDQLDISRRHAADLQKRHRPLDLSRARRPGHRLRVGFLGADFYDQATSYLMVGMIEERDRAAFEYIAYDYGDARDDPARQRILAAFDRYRSVSELDNEAIARLIGEDELDVLVFLRNPGDPRYAVLAYRPAPVQVAYLYNPSGYGAPLTDFLVADAVVVPPELEHHYSERIARLPICYQPNDGKRPLPQPRSRAEVGLPGDRFVLANLGSPFKITPAMFDLWCELLRKHAQCVLWLLEPRQGVAANLRLEASLRGVDPSRLIFAPLASTSDHLSRLACADLMLDTHPYGGHTGSSDALWAGVPVLTLAGETFASRVAASLLHAVGLSCLVAREPAEYVRIASDMIESNSSSSACRAYLQTRRGEFGLFNSRHYAQHFEALLRHIVFEGDAMAHAG